jgi:EF-hand domain pair/EF hand
MGTINPMETTMNTFTKLSIASALMLSAAFGVASAQQANETSAAPGVEQADDDMAEGQGMGRHGGKHHGGKHGGGRHGGGRGMHMIDANNDGVIGEDEAAALADHAFMRMDDDRDGKVTEAEFVSGPRGKRGGWFNWNSDEKAAVEKVRKDKFATLDTNKDASLDKAEFFAEAKSKLAAADTDKDGKVSPWEFRATR